MSEKMFCIKESEIKTLQELAKDLSTNGSQNDQWLILQNVSDRECNVKTNFWNDA